MSAHILSPALASAVLVMTAAGTFKLEYQYNLATVAGDIRTSAVTLNYDRLFQELYVVGYGQVRVFNPAGMEVFRFGDDPALGSIHGVAALEDGDLLAISYRNDKPGLLHLNFRGEILETVELSGVPEAYRDFGPSAIAYQNGRVYLADLMGMRVLLVRPAGKYLASYDLAQLLQIADRRLDNGMNGFGVDRDGNILFTVSPLFKAYVVSLAGEVRSFGRPGSAPGHFGIVAGIGSDGAGRYYVADSLKAAVMVFDRDLRFLGEFGGWGQRPGALVGPTSVAVADGRVFVSQYGNRGVAVYQVRGE